MSIKDLANSLQEAASHATAAVKESAAAAVDRVTEAKEQLSDALPSKAQVKTAVGTALVTGGKVLIDPSGTIGQAAVKVGESLLGTSAGVRWFVVEVSDDGESRTFAFTDKSQAMTFYADARKQAGPVYLCEVVDGPERKET
ncbi:MAG: hypothetical protein U1F52_08545 [Burkholderiales bacterium]